MTPFLPSLISWQRRRIKRNGPVTHARIRDAGITALPAKGMSGWRGTMAGMR